VKPGDKFPDGDFLGGVRGKYARRPRLERPNLVNVITTVVAMIYLAFFSSPFFLPNSFLRPDNPAPQQTSLDEWAVVILCALLLLGAWAYLIQDLIRQISLFFRQKTQ